MSDSGRTMNEQCAFCGVTHSVDLSELHRCRERVAKQRDVIAVVCVRALKLMDECGRFSNGVAHHGVEEAEVWAERIKRDMRTVLFALPGRDQ